MNSHEIAASAGVTYRQIDNWVAKKFLRPLGGGSPGLPREWSMAEAGVARRMGALVRAGVYPEKAHKMARYDAAALERLLVALGPCMGSGELRWRLPAGTSDSVGGNGGPEKRV